MPAQFEETKAYRESVTSTGRFLVSAVVVLLLVAIVIEWQLYNHKFEISTLRSRIAEQETRVANDQHRVGRNLSQIDATSLEGKADIAMTALKALRTGDTDSLSTPIATLGQLRDAEVAKPVHQRNEQLLRDLAIVSSVLDRLKQELPRHSEARKAIESSISGLKEELKAEEEKKTQSIPTPFGTFDIPPRLGLLLLTFAAVASYFAFVSGVSQVRREAVAIARGSDSNLSVDLPFWTFPLDRQTLELCRKEDDRIRPLAGRSLHILWLLFGIGLVVECTRWNRLEPVWYSSITFIRVALWLGVLAQAVIATRQTLGSAALVRIVRPIESALSVWHPTLTRRRFLVLVSSTIAAAAASRLLWTRFRRRNFLQVRREELVLNSASGVLHHNRVCADHLPRGRNSGPAPDAIAVEQIHQSKAARILENLSVASDPAGAATFLMVAIRRSPESIHLYDRLIRTYGQQRRYGEILPLITSARTSLGVKLANQALVGKRRAAVERLAMLFDSRIAHVKKRAQR